MRGITTTSGCVTALINDAYNSDHDKTADDTQLREIAANVDKLLMIARESESMIYQERDGINTLLHFYEVQEFHSADKRLSDSEPHEVMSRSNDNYKSIVHQRSVDKGANSLQDKQSD
ncbi:hypothetical protein KQH97_07675 [Ruminococcus sp. MSJ-25]|uniref:hypothetical protein n=1 Tax=Ruminococcus sp. MSJ-25 TaxID=2841536 RepID=UPI001C10BA38|nr:hypothetical protein [Ruminococcus sp. MSJ-25]MBU5408174.1 hypothetical protein [Ruminococcus sp. MSJ-25]